MNKICYSLNADTLSATFWAESNPNEKATIQGRWQTYAGDRASKNNTRIIFSNLPAFCEPQRTITLNPNEPTGEFVPRLNTKAHTGAVTRKLLFENVKVCDLEKYLNEENDIKALYAILSKAKQAFEKQQAEEQIKAGIRTHLAGLEKLGVSPEALLKLLQEQQKASEQEGGGNE